MTQILQNQPNILEINPRMKMIGKALFITALFVFGSCAQRENFIIEGNENFVESQPNRESCKISPVKVDTEYSRMDRILYSHWNSQQL